MPGAALCCAVAAVVTAVIDGDTLAVRAAAWPGFEATATVRLIGIDTPELRGRCERETAAAIAARTAAADLAPPGARVILSGIDSDKYGRTLARVTLADGRDLAEALLAAGHGRPYAGGARQGWCDE